MDEKVDRIRIFKNRADSLRLPASRVAALSGYHPYAVLPELFLDLIYQGRTGYELRLQDARDLGMELVSADALLLELAKKAGVGTANALESAIQVKHGAKKLENVKVAETLKKKVLEEAKKSKKLSADEIKKLAAGTRSYVDTGFGTHHEDEALDLFEKQCGWEVRERNASILNWPFARSAGDSAELTATPMGPAKLRDFMHKSKDRGGEGEQKPQEDSTDKLAINRTIANEDQKVKLCAETNVATTEARKDEQQLVVNATIKHDDQTTNLCSERSGATTGASNDEQQAKPFFIISGAVDGVRDELWCPPGQKGSDFDQDWELRSVIVECKHRMRRAYNIPPLYDQIQTTVYCLMHGTDQADIIQVMRKAKKRERPAKRRKEQPAEELLAPGQKKLEDFLERKSKPQEDSKPQSQCHQKGGRESSENKESETEVEADAPAKKPPAVNLEPTIEIFVSRLSLQDQVMNHQHNWSYIILPRLRSFVDAVYRVRADDDARKLFLEVVAREENTGYATQVSWDILHHQCPWLKDCDTALHKLNN